MLLPYGRRRVQPLLASVVVIMAERPTNTADLAREQVCRVVDVRARFTSSGEVRLIGRVESERMIAQTVWRVGSIWMLATHSHRFPSPQACQRLFNAG